MNDLLKVLGREYSLTVISPDYREEKYVVTVKEKRGYIYAQIVIPFEQVVDNCYFDHLLSAVNTCVRYIQDIKSMIDAEFDTAKEAEQFLNNIIDRCNFFCDAFEVIQKENLKYAIDRYGMLNRRETIC